MPIIETHQVTMKMLTQGSIPRYATPTVEDLHQAIRLNDIQRVKKILSLGVNLNTKLRSTTALSLAIYLGQEKMVELLLDFGASVDKLSVDSSARIETPLFTACRMGHIGVVRSLIDCGANLNSADFYSHTPLWIATREKRTDIISVLIKNGAKLNVSENWYQCPLYLTAKYPGRTDIAKSLIYHGCNLNITNIEGKNALFWCIQSGGKEMINYLLAAGSHFIGTLPKKSLLPAALQNDEEFSNWLCHECSKPVSLQKSCRTSIRQHLRVVNQSKSIVKSVESLPVPSRMISFLLLPELEKLSETSSSPEH